MIRLFWLIPLVAFSLAPAHETSHGGIIRSGGWTVYPDREEFWDRVSFQNETIQAETDRLIIHKEPELWHTEGNIRFDYQNPQGDGYRGVADKADYDKLKKHVSASGLPLDLEIRLSRSTSTIHAQSIQGFLETDTRTLSLRDQVHLRQDFWETFSEQAYWDPRLKQLRLEKGPPLVWMRSSDYTGVFQAEEVEMRTEAPKTVTAKGHVTGWIHLYETQSGKNLQKVRQALGR